jgi:hypothetical protein
MRTEYVERPKRSILIWADMMFVTAKAVTAVGGGESHIKLFVAIFGTSDVSKID